MITKKGLRNAVLIAAGLVSPADAADFFTAIKSPQPGQVEFLSTFSQADRFVDKYGNKSDLDLSQWVNVAIFKLKNDKFYASATFPHVQVDNDTIDERLDGLGDIAFEVGPHFKFENMYLMPTLVYNLSTERYDECRTINLGTGKDWIGGSMFLTYLNKDWIFDLYGRHIDQIDGKLYKNRVGGAIGVKNAMWIFGGGIDYIQECGGQKKLSAGPLIRYIGKDKKWHVTFGVETSLYERNCPDDWAVFARLRFPIIPKNHPAAQRNYNNRRR